MTEQELQAVFLSYNAADKNFVRKLAVALSVTGARVWFDEWTIRPGDSIMSEINNGLETFGQFALVWSVSASKSRWVKTEMEAAVARWIDNPASCLVPVLLDNTPLPPILRSIRYINCMDGDQIRVARELLGIETASAFRRAVQNFISEVGLDFREFWGVGVLVACPHCGTTPENLEAWSSIDRERDDRYTGVRCKVCGWSDNGEA